MTSNQLDSRTILIIVIAGVALILGGLVIAQATPLIFPVQASAESQQIDNLFHIALVIGGAIFLLVQGLLVYSIVRFRARAGDASDGINLHGNTTLEIVWTAIPAVIVLVLTILSYQVWVSIQSVKTDEMTVKVTGARFAWSFAYEVPDPRDTSQKLTINSKELHTYVGRPMKLEMVTQDVIHSFWVPAFRMKQDVMPGRTTTVRFTPIQTEETYPVRYPIKCAELCGSGHGEMVNWIVVHQDEADYMAWFNQQLDLVLNPPEDPVARGRQVLASGAYPCAGCHVLADLGWAGLTGPSLNGIGDRAATVRANATGLSPEEYLDRSIYYPNEYIVPGFGAGLMPQFQANDPQGANYMSLDDHFAIVAYLCAQTSTGESACDLDRLRSLVFGNS